MWVFAMNISLTKRIKWGVDSVLNAVTGGFTHIWTDAMDLVDIELFLIYLHCRVLAFALLSCLIRLTEIRASIMLRSSISCEPAPTA